MFHLVAKHIHRKEMLGCKLKEVCKNKVLYFSKNTLESNIDTEWSSYFLFSTRYINKIFERSCSRKVQK